MDVVYPLLNWYSERNNFSMTFYAVDVITLIAHKYKTVIAKVSN